MFSGLLSNWAAGHAMGTLSTFMRQAGPNAAFTPFKRLRTRTFSKRSVGTGSVMMLLSFKCAHAVPPTGPPGLPGFAWLL